MEKKKLKINIINMCNSYSVRPKSIIELISNLNSLVKEQLSGILNIIFVGTKRSKKLNKKYRNKDKPTNVLSFSFEVENLKNYVNEIIICPEIAYKEALKEGNDFNDYVAFLIIHSFLHCLGYDHEKEKERKEMEKMEEDLFKKTAKISLILKEGR